MKHFSACRVLLLLWTLLASMQYHTVISLQMVLPSSKNVASGRTVAAFMSKNNILNDNNRRNFLANTATAVATITTTVLLQPQQSAWAVAPITTKEIDGGVGVPRWTRPKPPSPTKVPRQPLGLDLAVMLTRGSYIETAQLDVGPVQQLERDMYLVRTSEYEPYRDSLAEVGATLKQGDLTDPYYFDYMSLVQYLTINRALSHPEAEYDDQEFIMDDNGVATADFNTRHVSRSVPNDKLVTTHDERVGTAILSYLTDVFGSTEIAIPAYDSFPDTTQVFRALKQLVNLFLVSGFAWEGTAVVQQGKNNNGSFLLTLKHPATLWSAQCLAKAKAPLRNDFLLKTAKQLVKSMGYRVVSSSVKVDGTSEQSYLTIAPASSA